MYSQHPSQDQSFSRPQAICTDWCQCLSSQESMSKNLWCSAAHVVARISSFLFVCCYFIFLSFGLTCSPCLLVSLIPIFLYCLCCWARCNVLHWDLWCSRSWRLLLTQSGTICSLQFDKMNPVFLAQISHGMGMTVMCCIDKSLSGTFW